MKLCFSCFKLIPLFASKCPYCLHKKQTAYGRIFIGLLVVAFIVFLAFSQKDEEDFESFSIESEEELKQDSKSLTTEELLKELKRN